jgi:hypothetical protein
MGGGNLLVCQVLSPLSLSPFKKVGFRFGSAGVFGLVSQGPLGLWRPWFPWWGSTGGRCFPRLTLALEFADFGADFGADAEENERGSTSVRWVSGSGTHGSFCLALWGLLGLWRLWFRAGVPRVAAVFPWSIPDPGIRLSR